MKILVIYHRSIFSTDTGAQNRVHNLTKELSKNNEIITLEPYQCKAIEPNFPVENRYYFKNYELGNLEVGAYLADLNPSFFNSVNVILRNESPSIIHKHSPYGISSIYLASLFSNDVTLLYDSHDVQADKYRQYYSWGLKEKLSFINAEIVERASCYFSDHVITVSNNDKERFIEKYSISPSEVSVIPSGTRIPENKSLPLDNIYEKFDIDGEKTIVVFHGTYVYNSKRAIQRIQNVIAPCIKEKYGDDVTFIIAGKGVPEMSSPNITSLGFVKDLSEILRIADIAIVPILAGGGTSLKVLDYLGHGIPIVSTKTGVRGLDIEDGKHALLTSDIERDFINSLILLIEDSELRSRLGTNGKLLAKKKYDWSKIGAELNERFKIIAKDKDDNVRNRVTIK